MLKDLIKS